MDEKMIVEKERDWGFRASCMIIGSYGCATVEDAVQRNVRIGGLLGVTGGRHGCCRCFLTGLPQRVRHFAQVFDRFGISE